MRVQDKPVKLLGLLARPSLDATPRFEMDTDVATRYVAANSNRVRSHRLCQI